MTATATTLAAVQAPVQTTEQTPAPPAVPPYHADYAYEWKLGVDSAADPHAVCPIQLSHLFADSRRRAWFEGRLARRKQLGLKTRHLQPITVGKGGFAR